MYKKLRERVKKGIPKSWKLFFAILPFIIVTYLYCYRPLWGLGYAFVEYKPMVSIWDSEFVGLKFFRTFFENNFRKKELLRVLRNTLVMNMIGFLTSYLAMFVTVMLNEVRSKRYKKLVQNAITVPHFISWIIVYSAFYQLLAPNSGLISTLLREWGIIEGQFDILTSSDKGYAFMWLLGNWKSLGWSTIIYFSALSGIDQELYEAAAIDGAGRFAKIRYITLPGLMPTYITLLIMSIGNFMSSDFEKAFVFCNSFNRDTVENLSLYVYNIGLGSGDFSLATAVGLFTSAVGLILMFASNYLAKKIRGTAIF